MWYGGLSVVFIVALGMAVGVWFKGGQERQTEIETDLKLTVGLKKPSVEKAEGREERTAKASLAPGNVFRDRLKIGGEGPEMVVIPAGTFKMGDIQGGGDKDETTGPCRAHTKTFCHWPLRSHFR